ncbi:uroporphyrinogen-III C-methyltransferase [Agarivorans sp. MS3-6]|uniref:uroporphyrinogen-III C-methyltransferase n=1 Tax=Agarivorans sp. TSD2052 TaxID=2937286 RepID=UPI00200E9EBC|nr:uroporphyrinogen-III C-methyltransferase [Agarivorans sp. TSD2052]UPW19072.1 uroporphyrinogen-III C-methyltransferase [Agarivorans sp. TSD2052]
MIERISQHTRDKSTHTIQAAMVDLVGAGPGDPELLTLKALRSIEQADLILYDRLVSQDILELIPTGTQAIYVGKAKANHCIPQDQLNLYMVDKAKQGLRICRLKGGDPFVFGRGSEELEVLHQHDVPARVIPGITAASGCTSYAGIPLTHRGLATGCSFITGHKQDGKLDINWAQLAQLDHTLVFYMGLSSLPEISQQLQAFGKRANTPAALIEKGCQNDQRVITGTLDQLPTLASEHLLQSPTLIVIGEVVSLREQLDWLTKLDATSTPFELEHSAALSA